MNEKRVAERESDASLKRISIIANVIVGVVATLAILACVILYLKIDSDNRSRQCVRDIDRYGQTLRDDISSEGWETLVSRAEGDKDQDVHQVANDMNAAIKHLKDTRSVRDDAMEICAANPDYKPQ